MRRYGLLGYPLTHSFSQTYFTKKFIDEGIVDAQYDNFSFSTIGELQDLLMNEKNLAGFNITIPYKKEVLAFLDELTEPVKEMGACNCVRIVEGRRIGYSTDIIGFAHSIKPFLQAHRKAALILGTGGAAAAVEYVFRKAGISYQYVSRTKGEHSLCYADIDKNILETHHIIVNTSPVGQYPNIDAAPAIPYEYLTAQHHLFDLIYNPAETVFLQKGKAQGATVQNGQQMLVIQAEESWKIWNR